VTTRETWIANAPEDVVEKFPHARQIVVVRSTSEPRRPEAKPRETETRYYVITGPPGLRRLTCQQAAKMVRGHWGIENRLHHTLDRTFREDEQKFRTGDGPQALSLLRGLGLAVLQNHLPPRLARVSKPEARQTLAARPRIVARLITRPLA
jgi:hypothetical protein